MKSPLNTSNSPRRDVYFKDSHLRSLDSMPEELLHHLVKHGEFDAVLDEKRKALEWAMQFLSQKEVELVFFRFLQGNSLKTLKKTIKIGSTKTAVNRIRKLKACIKAYIIYYLSSDSDYDRDIKIVVDELGPDAGKVAKLLFRRHSKNKIHRDRTFRISQVRLGKTVRNIRLLCTQRVTLTEFWKVLETVGKIPEKK